MHDLAHAAQLMQSSMHHQNAYFSANQPHLKRPLSFANETDPRNAHARSATTAVWGLRSLGAWSAAAQAQSTTSMPMPWSKMAASTLLTATYPERWQRLWIEAPDSTHGLQPTQPHSRHSELRQAGASTSASGLSACMCYSFPSL